MSSTCAKCNAEAAVWLCQLCGLRFCGSCVDRLPKRKDYDELLHTHRAIGRLCTCGGSIWLHTAVWHA